MGIYIKGANLISFMPIKLLRVQPCVELSMIEKIFSVNKVSKSLGEPYQ